MFGSKPNRINLPKVKSEAGTHFAAQSKAPDAVIENSGLCVRLTDTGYTTQTFDALSGNQQIAAIAEWQLAPKVNGVRNEESTSRVLHNLHKELTEQLPLTKAFPIVVGGDCSITSAVLSAFCKGFKRHSEALQWLNEGVDVIFVHFDVDVIDCGEFLLANYPHYAGIDAEKVFTALEVALRNKKVEGLAVTEINPNNVPTGKMVERVVSSIVKGMEGRIDREM